MFYMQSRLIDSTKRYIAVKWLVLEPQDRMLGWLGGDPDETVIGRY